MKNFFLAIFLLVSLSINGLTSAEPIIAAQTKKPAIQQGVSYKKVADISQYWLSEKLDGMRGYWNGKQLLTRQGHVIYTPKWFTNNWPETTIDGELWIARNKFQQTVSCVRKKVPNDQCWRQVKFMIFDLPNHQGIFSQRVAAMIGIAQQSKSLYLHAVKQFKVADLAALDKVLNQIIAQSGEGLMLHLGSAYYHVGRTNALLKLKKYQDAEAKVIGHIQGKGKYKNMLGALQVKTSEGIIFKIGSGFTDNDRANPPEIGSLITFKYNGKTQAGIPRFARYWRIRADK